MDTPTQYCEHAVGFLTQPWNVITNVFFIIAALVACRSAVKKNIASGKIILLVVLAAFIGIGSGLWHITEQPWGELVDTLSILIFALVATYLLFAKIFHKKVFALLGLGGLLIAAYFIEQLPHLNGSLVYVFLLGILSTTIIVLSKRYVSIQKYLVPSIGVFAFAIVMRTIDPFVCTTIPMGTHFLWHIGDAVAAYYLIVIIAEVYKEKNLTK